MNFIVETPFTHHGIKLYVTKAESPSRGLRLKGIKDGAVRFSNKTAADVARMRFSSLYGLVVVEDKS